MKAFYNKYSFAMVTMFVNQCVIGLFGKLAQAALGLYDFDGSRIVADSKARRIITPVFQLGEAVQKNGRSLIIADISNNSTHMVSFLQIQPTGLKILLYCTFATDWKYVRSYPVCYYFNS